MLHTPRSGCFESKMSLIAQKFAPNKLCRWDIACCTFEFLKSLGSIFSPKHTLNTETFTQVIESSYQVIGFTFQVKKYDIL